MAIAQLLAVVPVSDIEAARTWYTRLFGPKVCPSWFMPPKLND